MTPMMITRRLLAAALTGVLLSTSLLLAKDLNLRACTADHLTAVLTIDINDAAPSSTVNSIKVAFVKTASSMSADELVYGSGFRVFISNLTEEDYSAINGIEGPPVIGESCQ